MKKSKRNRHDEKHEAVKDFSDEDADNFVSKMILQKMYNLYEDIVLTQRFEDECALHDGKQLFWLLSCAKNVFFLLFGTFR